MQITIIGTGGMARGIASRALAGGHDVAFIGTERAKADVLAASSRSRSTPAPPPRRSPPPRPTAPTW
jgi:hypothetical protein